MGMSTLAAHLAGLLWVRPGQWTTLPSIDYRYGEPELFA
jgi:hypothetical protein